VPNNVVHTYCFTRVKSVCPIDIHAYIIMKSRLERVYDSFELTACALIQVIFTVSVNLQGLFIFGFHCARLPSVRQSWKSTIVTRLSSNSSSNSSAAASRPVSTTVPRSVAAARANVSIGTDTELRGRYHRRGSYFTQPNKIQMK